MNEKEQWIKDTNEWALKVGDAIFNKEYYRLRQVLTDDTWKLIVSNLNITDPADKRFKMIPTKFLEQAMQGSVRKAINEDGVKLAGLAAAVPGAIIGTSLLAEVAPSAINFLTKAGEKAYPFTLKWIEPVFNKMNPFSKEFALMGSWGKGAVGVLESAGFLHAINTTSDFINDPKVYKIPDVVMADMIGLPYGLAAGQRLYGAYNRAAAPFRMARLMNLNVRNTNLGTTVFDDAVLLGKVGWAPSLTINYRHGSDKADLKRFIPYTTWDVEKHGASPFKFFGTEVSSPRNMMDERPFLYFGSTELKKPMVLIGEFNPLGVKNNTRNLLVNESRRRGADSYYLQNIADNKAENQNVLIKFINNEGEQVGKPTSIKWYGPTMGKTTATKIHDELVDIDPLLKPIRQKYADILGLDIRDPKVSQHPEYKLAVADFVLDWRMNPENQGKTLLASTKHLLDPDYKIQFGNDPSIPDFETFAARNKARGFKETDELLRAWYDSIFKQGRDLNIDNRFVLDIEDLLPNTHLQGDDAVRMFKQYLNDAGDISLKESINIDLLKRYIPEVRERYGLAGNDNITDDEILKALYRHTNELGKETAAVNVDGEPLLLFRGSTSRHDKLIPKGTSELPVSGADNILGNLFLGELPGSVQGGDHGIARYLGLNHGWLGPIPPQTRAAEVILPESKILDKDMYTLYTSEKFGDVKKLPGYALNTGYNDINAFIVRTPNVRDATEEIVVINPFNTIPEHKRLGQNHGEHYRALIKDAESKNQGLIHSKPVIEIGPSGEGIGKFRDEHEYYNYFALPNFNILNAKHILPYDLRIPRNWEDPIIYRKQGGTIDYLNLFKNNFQK